MTAESRGLSKYIAIVKALKIPQILPKSMDNYKFNCCSYYIAQLVGHHVQLCNFYCIYSCWVGKSTNLLNLSRKSGFTFIKHFQKKGGIILLYWLLVFYRDGHTPQESFRMVTFVLGYANIQHYM